MTAMKIPGFTAINSLGPCRFKYRSTGVSLAAASPMEIVAQKFGEYCYQGHWSGHSVNEFFDPDFWTFTPIPCEPVGDFPDPGTALYA